MKIYNSYSSMLDDLLGIQDDFNRYFREYGFTGRHEYPLLNIQVSKDAALIDAEIPGIEREDLSVTSVGGNLLKIAGEARAEAAGDGDLVVSRERFAGNFERTVELPFKIDGESVSAKVRNGILRIEVKRARDDMPRRVQIECA